MPSDKAQTRSRVWASENMNHILGLCERGQSTFVWPPVEVGRVVFFDRRAAEAKTVQMRDDEALQLCLAANWKGKQCCDCSDGFSLGCLASMLISGPPFAFMDFGVGDKLLCGRLGRRCTSRPFLFLAVIIRACLAMARSIRTVSRKQTQQLPRAFPSYEHL